MEFLFILYVVCSGVSAFFVADVLSKINDDDDLDPPDRGLGVLAV